MAADMRSLNTELRATKLEDFVGCDSIIASIKEGLRQGRVDNTYVFTGPPGTGKTTLARIVAKLVQGEELEQYDIIEPDTGELGADDIRQLVATSHTNPWFGKYKCIIIDEAHKMSGPAMLILLKDLEEAAASTVWFICSSEGDKIPPALMRRGSHFCMPDLSTNDVELLIRKALKSLGGEIATKYGVSKKYKELVQALDEQDIVSAGIVYRALEKFITGIPAKEAARTSESSSFDSFGVAKAAGVGDWAAVKQLLKNAPKKAGREVRSVVAGYFRSILLNQPANSAKAAHAAAAIKKLADLANQNQYEDGLIFASLASALYYICVELKPLDVPPPPPADRTFYKGGA